MVLKSDFGICLVSSVFLCILIPSSVLDVHYHFMMVCSLGKECVCDIKKRKRKIKRTRRILKLRGKRISCARDTVVWNVHGLVS